MFLIAATLDLWPVCNCVISWDLNYRYVMCSLTLIMARQDKIGRGRRDFNLHLLTMNYYSCLLPGCLMVMPLQTTLGLIIISSSGTKTQRNLKNTLVHPYQCLAWALHNWLLSVQLNDLTSHFLSSHGTVSRLDSEGSLISFKEFVYDFTVYFERFMHFMNFF